MSGASAELHANGAGGCADVTGLTKYKEDLCVAGASAELHGCPGRAMCASAELHDVWV